MIGPLPTTPAQIRPPFSAPARSAAVATLPTPNPVLATDSPDPGVIYDGHRWVLATTGDGPEGAFPLYQSDDMVHWKPDGSIFPAGQTPTWAKNSYWAPEIHKVEDHYVAYFTARDDKDMLRVGAATSNTVDGPFKDIGHPLVSEPNVGVIDPTYFQDDNGKQYVYWKEDGNGAQPQLPSRILVSEVSKDGTSLVGPSKVVLQNDPKSWEGTVVEAPEMVKHNNEYYLFYSGNGYAGDAYAEGVARSSSPTGPFEKEPAPMIHSSDDWKGPGHAGFTTDANGKDWLLFHAWEKGHEGQAPGRELLLSPLTWGNDNWPHVDGNQPSDTISSLPKN